MMVAGGICVANLILKSCSGRICDIMKINGIHQYKRVGKIKMLIEALKGDG